MERTVKGLKHFLGECEFVYLNGASKTVETCEIFISNVKNVIELKKTVSDAYLFEPLYSPDYRRH